MVYPQPFLRLVVSGSLFTTEGFSWSLSLLRTSESAVAPNEVPQGVIDAVATFHTTPSVVIGTQARLEMIKLNEIGPNGRYTNQGDTVLYEFDPPVQGTATQNSAPQLSVAVSLGTDARRGRAHAGRFYPPLSSYQLQSDGRISEAQQGLLADAAVTLITDLNDALPNHLVGVTSDIGTGTERLVTHVRVGAVVDTIRSRRTSLDERYVERPLV